MKFHPTHEIVTDENFNEARYLAANPDVKISGVQAWFHFDKAGRKERRKQLAIDTRDRALKYKRFRHVLQKPHGDDPEASFPIVTSDNLYNIDNYAGESTNNSHAWFDEEIISNPKKNYLDLGCGLRDRTFDNCLYLEVYNSISADLVVAPCCPYPIRNDSFDGIGCFTVLEHTRQPWRVVSEIYRILKPGGKAFIDWPFLQPVHGYPSHYFNATREGLKTLFSDNGFIIEICETQNHNTISYTISWILRTMCAGLPEGRTRRAFEGMTIRELIELEPDSPKWNQFISVLDDKKIEELACGNFLLAAKPET
ncbi:Methyltransferase domain-containing protein [Methylobacterium sp. UNC300MFChir4.1]|uniref:class I SAM-dependent methyltransferase n=1 Tax=Methylobacterium sp. UNC300MFChir4.1 TaxID=1502747 RepID=UPI0008C692E9|nr:class I SAM-dependent methyltransferase [Methylobacterium sp. UNC300MFChir4.1]SEP42006.1 Methyltransferase domain-containing protein [Methylobacterium sp. UNC300MFChir4.1]